MLMRTKCYVWLLLVSFMSSGFLSSSLEASGSSECLRLYEKALLTGREVLSFDLVKMQAWVEAQPAELRPFAAMLTRRYELVSIAAFTDLVVNTTSQLLGEFPKEKLIFVYQNSSADRSYKSGAWVAGIIYEKFPNLRGVPAVDRLSGNFKTTLCLDPPCVYVYVDDASYSGHQAKAELVRMVRKLEQQSLKAVRIVALIPAVTQEAMNVLESIDTSALIGQLSNVQAERRVKVFSSYKMKTVREIATEEGVEIPECRWFDVDTTVTYFGHKIADNISTHSFFSLGQVMIRIPGGYWYDSGQDIRFIPRLVPPYFIPVEPVGD